MGSLLKGTSKQSLECGRRGLGGGVGGRHGGGICNPGFVV